MNRKASIKCIRPLDVQRTVFLTFLVSALLVLSFVVPVYAMDIPVTGLPGLSNQQKVSIPFISYPWPVTMNIPLPTSNNGQNGSGFSDVTTLLSSTNTRTTIETSKATSSNPVTPVHVGRIVHGGNVKMNQPKDVFVSGKYVYVVSKNANALEIIDISGAVTPAISNIIPSSGQQGGTYTLTITGAKFEPQKSTVSFSDTGVSVKSYSSRTASRIVCKVAINTKAKTGKRTITVKNPTGGAIAIKTFTVKAKTATETNTGQTSGIVLNSS